MKEMMSASASASAKKKGRQRKKRILHPPRPDPTRIRRPPPPLEARRSLRPRQRCPLEEEEEEEERGRRKLKLVVKIPHIPTRREGRYSDSRGPSFRIRKPPSAGHVPPSASSSSSPSPTLASSFVDDEDRKEEEEGEFDEDSIKPPKKRRIDCCEDAVASSDGSGHREEGKRNVVVRRSVGSVSGALRASTTTLPERAALVLILDKLQKKDIYGVYAEPVDPEELPGYHDVIEHPMDFGTVRKKLASGAYRSFEQFEDDVFLICSNAMQYNAPDTIYFRQAHAIQDMARQKFQRIRADGKSSETVRADGKSAETVRAYSKSTETVRADGKYAETDLKSEEKIRFSFIDKKTPKKSQCRTAQEPLGSDLSSGATLASAGETFTGLSIVQASGIERSASVNGFVDGSSSLGESKSEKADEISAKSSPSKLGLKPFLVDENRRATYNTSEQQPVTESDSVFDVFESETKKLVAVELDAEYSYARSLAHFAASLGPVAWEIASKRIEKVLPPGVKFGPGWVGEYEPLPTPVLYLGNRTHQHPTVVRKKQESEAELVATRSGNHKDMPFGLNSQTTTGMSHRASNPVKLGTFRERTTERKLGLFGVNLETQPRISSTITVQQKNQAGVSFAKSYTDETAAQSPFCSKSANSKFPVIISRERSEVQPEPPKPLEAVTWRSRNNDVSVMDARGFSNGKPMGNSDITRPITSSGIISSHQTGVQYSLARGNHEPAINDPSRLMSFSGKMSNQPNTSNKGIDNLERVPTILPPRREKSSAAAAPRAWMSIGSSTECKSVGGGLSQKQVRPASLSNAAWKTPPSDYRVHEDPEVRPEPIQGVTGASAASQVQNKGLVIFPQLITTDLSRLRSPWQGLVQQNKQKDMLRPDLNIGYQPPGSPARPSSGVLIDSQQPDLALQL